MSTDIQLHSLNFWSDCAVMHYYRGSVSTQSPLFNAQVWYIPFAD